MTRRQESIDRKYLILCEGLDAYNFLVAYLNSDALQYDCRFNTGIQCWNFEGITQLSGHIKRLKRMDHFLEVKSILVIRDAETSVESAEDSIKAALRNNALPVPVCCNQWDNSGEPRIAYTLFPACCEPLRTGALEDLCWDILADDKASEYRKDVQLFLNQINGKYQSIMTHEHKGRLHTYFSVKDELVTLKLGEAAKHKAFDWRHKRLEPLRRLIVQGFEEET